ncbi:DUF1998 domain-containing protein [Butyrivibrio sp. VCD2006]|uniref:DUF1998 domain-containing protein n=1 Tax=Butyrivibrio sp. VCD2006 TaxID=1280664 RepID=UPI0003FF667C|nr:DUF1998 domain-containing protein [Butyrivibrio sp. VCD2006]
MAFKIKPKTEGKTTTYRFKIAGEIRKSQSITTYGPGALIDLPRISGIISGTDNWESSLGKPNFVKMKIHERNLERILGKKYFIQASTVPDKRYINGINIERFPEYCYCPECGALDKYYKIAKKTNNVTDYNSDSFCGICYQSKSRNVKLIPSRFVVACTCGHMDEFPYEWWVHRNGGRCANPKLTIEMSKTTSSLDGITIKCQCGAKENLEGVMDRGSLHMLRCYGAMPWLGKNEDYRGWYSENTPDDPCDKELRVLQRGANNVYYSDIVSALTIPPYSSRVQRILAGDMEILEQYNGMPDNLKKANLEYYFTTHEDRLRCTYEKFLQDLDYALGIESDNYNELKDLVGGEYDALCDEDCSDPDFLTIESDVPNEFEGLIDQVKIVGRLREVEVLRGFKRIAVDEGLTAQLSRKPLDWLPGNELYGEGIFIRLNEQEVQKWEARNAVRYSKLVGRAKDNFFAGKRVSDGNTRYILLHTLSHLILRELTMQCGYSAASIKEKIYSSEGGDKPMCGLLIYTAASDSDGSLGGLARQGVTEKLRDILMNMIENASWCSNDPICIESQAQGYASLNYAACHACSLLPETSCECSNILLDRAAIIGTTEDAKLGYFSRLTDF